MTSEQKLIQALAQIENLKTLLDGNEYQQYLYVWFLDASWCRIKTTTKQLWMNEIGFRKNGEHWMKFQQNYY